MAAVLKLILQICDYFIELFLLFLHLQSRQGHLVQTGRLFFNKCDFSQLERINESRSNPRTNFIWGKNKLRASVTKPPSEAGIVPSSPNSSVRVLWICGKPGLHLALPEQLKQSPSYQVKGDAFLAVQISIFIHLDTECPKWSIWPLIWSDKPFHVKWSITFLLPSRSTQEFITAFGSTLITKINQNEFYNFTGF